MKSASFDKMMSVLKSREEKTAAEKKTLAEASRKATETRWTEQARKSDENERQRMKDRRDVEEVFETYPLQESDLEEVESMEVMSVDEMLEGLVSKIRSVNAKLAEEESIARDIQKMGGQITQETRARIKMLDEKQKHLLKMHANVVSPSLKEAFKAKGRGEELLIPKPAEWDALMADEELYIELKPEQVKRPSSIELKTKEAQLQEEAELVERELDRMIDEINAQENLKMAKNSKLAAEAYSFEADKRPGIEGLMKDIYAGMRVQRQRLRDIEINLGMIRRLEG